MTAAPGSVLPELGCTPINGPIDDKQSVDLDGAVHGVCVCVCTRACACDKIRSRGRVVCSSYGIGQFCESYWEVIRLTVSRWEANIVFSQIVLRD